MIERIYNKVKFPKDETANAILNFLRSKIGDRRIAIVYMKNRIF